MGWYHFQLMDGKTPEEIEAEMTNPNIGTCERMVGTVVPGNTTTTTTTTVPASTMVDTTTGSSQKCGGDCFDGDVTTMRKEELYDVTAGPVYHLCQEKKWLEAVKTQQAYYPPTFWLDGHFTRGSCVLESLVGTANTYYKTVPGVWLVLEMDPIKLHQLGTPIAVHRAPESNCTSTQTEPVQCLKIYGGIPTTIPNLVTKIYLMERDVQDGMTFSRILPAKDSLRRKALPVQEVQNCKVTAIKRETALPREKIIDKKNPKAWFRGKFLK